MTYMRAISCSTINVALCVDIDPVSYPSVDISEYATILEGLGFGIDIELISARRRVLHQ